MNRSQVTSDRRRSATFASGAWSRIGRTMVVGRLYPRRRLCSCTRRGSARGGEAVVSPSRGSSSPVDGGKPTRKGGVGVATPGESQSQADLNAPRNLNSDLEVKRVRLRSSRTRRCTFAIGYVMAS